MKPIAAIVNWKSEIYMVIHVNNTFRNLVCIYERMCYYYVFYGQLLYEKYKVLSRYNNFGGMGLEMKSINVIPERYLGGGGGI